MPKDPTKPRTIRWGSNDERLAPEDFHRMTGVTIDPRDKTVGAGQCGKPKKGRR